MLNTIQIIAFIFIILVCLIVCIIIYNSNNICNNKYGGGKFSRKKLEDHNINIDNIIKLYKNYIDDSIDESLIIKSIDDGNLLEILKNINIAIENRHTSSSDILQDITNLQKYIDNYNKLYEHIEPDEHNKLDEHIELYEHIEPDEHIEPLPISMKQYINEWVDIYDVIVQPHNKIFVEDMENDECNKFSITECHTPCELYKDVCYLQSRLKQYNTFDGTEKVIKSKNNDAAEYTFLYTYRYVNNNIPEQAKDFIPGYRYSFVISKLSNVRYVLFNHGLVININELNDTEPWVSSMNELIARILDDSRSYIGKYIICGHSMGCSLMLFLAFKLFTEYNEFFINRCICFGSGQTPFFNVANIHIFDNFFKSLNIHIFAIAKRSEYPSIKEGEKIIFIDPMIVSPYKIQLYDTFFEYIYFPIFIIIVEINHVIPKKLEYQCIKWDDSITTEQKKALKITIDIGFNHYHQWVEYRKLLLIPCN
jgi:hypothetical protein